MTPIKDRIGEKYHDFTIESYVDRASNNEPRYLCRCKCGNTQVVRYWRLLGERAQKRCVKCNRGANSPLFRGYGEIGRGFWRKFERHAKQRGLVFDVSIEYGWDLFLRQDRRCALTGIVITMPIRDRDKYLCSASLDRIDSSKGYIQGNIQWVHKGVNRIKNEFDNEFFIVLCNLVSKHNRLDEIDTSTFEKKCMEYRTTAPIVIGDKHPKAVKFKIEKDTGEFVEGSGIRNFCRVHDLNYGYLTQTRKTGKFHRGYRLCQ